MAKKKKIKKNKVKEIFDLEVDEVSAVDMAAIGESFYITKSVNKTNKKGAKVAKKKKLPLLKAMPKWSENISKDGSDKCGEHCHFCGITKQVEEEEMGAGLRNSVCIGCALEHFDKGVFDDCLEFKFDIEEFKKKFPDVKLHELTQKADDDEDDSEDDEDDSSEDDKDGKGKKEGEEDSDSDDDEDDADQDGDDDSEEDEGSEKNKSGSAKSDEDEDGSEADSESNQGELSKRLVKVEKNLEDVTGMLERSLELHDFAAGALNEVVTLTFASIDMLMTLIEERMEDGESEAAVQQDNLFTSINESIKSVREDVTKAGAKISGKRMKVLREIAEKLSELIASVMNVDAEKGVTKALSEVQKSLEGIKEELKEDIKSFSSSIKEDVESKLEKMGTKLEDIEQSGGASFGLSDDDEDHSDEDKDEDLEKGESLFSGVLGIDEITKSIEKKRRNLK